MPKAYGVIKDRGRTIRQEVTPCVKLLRADRERPGDRPAGKALCRRAVFSAKFKLQTAGSGLQERGRFVEEKQ